MSFEDDVKAMVAKAKETIEKRTVQADNLEGIKAKYDEGARARKEDGGDGGAGQHSDV